MPTDLTHLAAGPTAARPADRGRRRLPLALLVAAGLLAALIALLSGAGFAQAGAFVVTKTADTADGACDADCSLREAIGAANDSPGADIITVPAGTYVLTLGTLDVTGLTTINGAGPGLSVIDGGSAGFGILSINGQEGAPITVTLAGLTIQRGQGTWSGGIEASYADLALNHTEVVSNTSVAGGGGGIDFRSGTLMLQSSAVSFNTAGGGQGSGYGGGINISSGSLTLRSSTISRNQAGFWGGGLAAYDTDVVLADSTVVSNTALGGRGGGIYFSKQTGTLTVLTSTISYNTTNGTNTIGGGIYAETGSLILQGSTITGHTAGMGGGVYASVNGQAKIVDTVVSHNTATSGYGGAGGGGLLLQTQAGLEIAGSTIEYNRVTDGRSGGGLNLYSNAGNGNPAAAAVTIRDSSFSQNSAGSGGGMFIDTAVPVTLTRTTLVQNQVAREDNPPSGGGIEVYGSGSIAFVDSTISDNVAHRHTITPSGCGAPFGAGISHYSKSPLLITNTTIRNNRAVVDTAACSQAAGGGVWIWLAPYTITESIFVGNSAETGGGLSGGGGGMITYQNTIRNTQFLSNTATAGDGGGFIGNDMITATGVTLQGNNATGKGGGAYIYGNLIVSQGLVKDNTAGGDGGGLAGNVQVISSTITGNRAANGGGLAVTESEISESLIAGNSAVKKGGGISLLQAYRGGPTVRIRNSTISGNQAAESAGISHGGPVYKLCQGGAKDGNIFQYGYGGKMLLDNTTIAANVAPTGAGGIRVNVETRDRDEVEAAECPFGSVNWGTGSDTIVLEMVNVLLAANDGDNCAALPANASLGHNLSDDGACIFTAPGDRVKVNAKLGPLAANGGPTLTHALLDGSPAIDAGSAANCPPTDQRGVTRPQGPACDIGAFEWQPAIPYLNVAPVSLAFTAVACAAPPPSQPLAVTNTGVGTLSWSATKNQPWLSVSPTAGAAPASPAVTVNQAGLAAGTYTGAVTFAATGAGGSPQAVNVTLSVLRDSDLVRNGGFEAGANGDWTVSSTKLPHLIRPAAELSAYRPPHGGSWAALMGVANGEVSQLSQSVLVPPGVTTLLKYWVYTSSPETDCSFDTAAVQVNGTTVKTHPLCQSGNTAGWTEASVPLTAYAGQQVTLRFRVANDALSDPSVFMLDDVRLAIDPPCTVTTVTPTATATPSPTPTLTRTPTPTATQGPPPSYDNFVYLPTIMR